MFELILIIVVFWMIVHALGMWITGTNDTQKAKKDTPQYIEAKMREDVGGEMTDVATVCTILLIMILLV